MLELLIPMECFGQDDTDTRFDENSADAHMQICKTARSSSL